MKHSVPERQGKRLLMPAAARRTREHTVSAAGLEDEAWGAIHDADNFEDAAAYASEAVESENSMFQITDVTEAAAANVDVYSYLSAEAIQTAEAAVVAYDALVAVYGEARNEYDYYDEDDEDDEDEDDLEEDDDEGHPHN